MDGMLNPKVSVIQSGNVIEIAPKKSRTKLPKANIPSNVRNNSTLLLLLEDSISSN